MQTMALCLELGLYCLEVIVNQLAEALLCDVGKAVSNTELDRTGRTGWALVSLFIHDVHIVVQTHTQLTHEQYQALCSDIN